MAMRLIGQGFTSVILAGAMLQGAPASAQPADLAQARPAAPAAPYRRCSSGRFASIGSSCALVAANGQPPVLFVKIECNLPARPAALNLIWSEREGLGGELLRLTPPSFAGASPAAGTILRVEIPLRYCRVNARRFTVELELEGGRNVGEIGRFSFACAN
jgi:hypothetical protein